ncbi:MAG: InlB B-repeat-containing protein [Bacilli bacterium]|nr:InlB B-repeat-containing protein [Bacilli bacterium]
MSKNDKKRRITIEIIGGFILLAIIIFLVLFLNHKYEISFYLDNGADVGTVQVKYNKMINEEDIKGKEDLGESFVAWYEIIDVQDGKDILAEKPFDFKTKINRSVKLKAVFNGDVKTITIKFDSKGGSEVKDIVIPENVKLKLPTEPRKAGYKFVVWEDKNGTPIYNDALLSEDTTLYAKWKKIEENKTTTNKQTQPKKDNKNTVSYYCESGYVLNGTKCTKTEIKNATGRCPQGFSAGAWDYDYCTTEIDPEEEYRCMDKMGYKASEAVLDSKTNNCYYRKDYAESNPLYCSNHGRVYYNGYCYYAKYKAELITYCAGGVNVNSSGMCDLKMKKRFSCENGWTLKNKKCTKTIVVDAKKK